MDGIFCFYVQFIISCLFGFGIQSLLKHDYLGDVNLAFFTSFGVVERQQHACSSAGRLLFFSLLNIGKESVWYPQFCRFPSL